MIILAFIIGCIVGFTSLIIFGFIMQKIDDNKFGVGRSSGSLSKYVFGRCSSCGEERWIDEYNICHICKHYPKDEEKSIL